MSKSWPTSKKDAINVALLSMVQSGTLQSLQDKYYAQATCAPFDPSAAVGGGDGAVTLQALGGVFEVLVFFQLVILVLWLCVRFLWPQCLSKRLCPYRNAALHAEAHEGPIRTGGLGTRQRRRAQRSNPSRPFGGSSTTNPLNE